uniref:SCP domain-containing protein n=1 Tax=Zooxanthella nutricula TaxID=1333877 RepID=A0A7S2QC99_9DINO
MLLAEGARGDAAPPRQSVAQPDRGPGARPAAAVGNASRGELKALTQSQAWAEEVLARHNVYRCMHGAPPLAWSQEIEAHAKQWAAMGRGQRSPPHKLRNVGPFAVVGENVANSVTDGGGSGSPGGQVQQWYDQITGTENGLGKVSEYSYHTAKYTQLVWKGTATVGCALYNNFLVCQYGPAGNSAGEFVQQVGERVKAQQDCMSQ